MYMYMCVDISTNLRTGCKHTTANPINLGDRHDYLCATTYLNQDATVLLLNHPQPCHAPAIAGGLPG